MLYETTNISSLFKDNDLNPFVTNFFKDQSQPNFETSSVLELANQIPFFASIQNSSSIYKKLHDISSLDNNWDGYGATPIESASLDNVKLLINRLPTCFPTPEVSPSPNGTVSLDWEIGNAGFSIEIGNTSFSAFFKDDTGIFPFNGAFDVDDVIRLISSRLSSFCPIIQLPHSIIDLP